MSVFGTNIVAFEGDAVALLKDMQWIYEQYPGPWTTGANFIF